MAISSLGAENANCPADDTAMELAVTGGMAADGRGFRGQVGREKGLLNAEPNLVASETELAGTYRQ